ncbi:MAG: alpha/beta hydrolase [Dehalococcoidia bacterium]
MATPQTNASSSWRAQIRRRRTPLLILLGVVMVAIAALAGGGWYYANLLKDGALVPDHDPDKLDLRVIALTDGVVTLGVTSEAEGDGDWQKDGVFGLAGENGYGQVGAILEIDDDLVVREFFAIDVDGIPVVGDPVRLDSFAFPGDPLQAFSIGFEDVTFPSQLGDLSAWFVDGPRDTWVIFVHGKGAERREGLRALPTISELGFPSLLITYRNDEGAPASSDGYYRYGQTEWKDLEAAAEYAVRQGADELIIVGYSMGGAIAISFLYESPLAERVAAVILDSPVLDFGATVDVEARQRGIPGLLTAVAKRIAGLRFDIDWDDLNYLSRADELSAPILLFHGDADETVPVRTSDTLAESRPDIVTYIRVEGADHVRAWNADPAAYESALRDFLAAVTGPR